MVGNDFEGKGRLMMDMPKEVRDLFVEERAAKFLATVDDSGGVNVALVVTLQPVPEEREDRLIFGEFLMWKTKENLLADSRVGVAAVNTKLKAAALTGDFGGFETSGPYKDAMDLSPFMRYNAYSGVRSAGVVDVRDCGEMRSFMAGMVLDLIRVRIRRGEVSANGVIPPRLVREKFLRLTSIKGLAVIGEDGYPRVYPALTVAAAGETGFVIRSSPYRREIESAGMPCQAAMCVVTMDAMSYKVKGELSSLGGGSFLFRVKEVYNAMPPLAGELIPTPLRGM
ncbi:MAG: hypothetical protein A2Y75_02665 [Candidatus Solincola sediminis]|uniref:Pyridoxamine 5'-phosphate oxidase putative domain-containing protein n=1 Tax=Candidatus Solincola sediminis TaxID=1797199 RepID=A0A1F2WJM8_9ACTN|nr:MAG: hypothetical protein A2Y75_02665 [Candidatus Solincola sediminis]